MPYHPRTIRSYHYRTPWCSGCLGPPWRCRRIDHLIEDGHGLDCCEPAMGVDRGGVPLALTFGDR